MTLLDKLLRRTNKEQEKKDDEMPEYHWALSHLPGVFFGVVISECDRDRRADIALPIWEFRQMVADIQEQLLQQPEGEGGEPYEHS